MGGPILITGAEGFVGRALGMRLAALWPRERIVGSTRAAEPLAAFHETIKLDLECDDLFEAFGRLKPSLVFHLAARSSVAESAERGWTTFSDNVGSSIALARAMREAAPGVPLVFASSGEVYGASFDLQTPISESTPPFPKNAYARSKLASEFALADILGAVCPVVILRLFNHFGRGQDERFVIPGFAGQIRRMRDARLERRIHVGNLDAIRDFLPIADVLEAYVAAAHLARSAGPGVDVYNIASGEGRAIRGVLNDLLRMSGLDVEIVVDPMRLRPSDIKKAIGNPERFSVATHWRPRARWDEALAVMLQPDFA